MAEKRKVAIGMLTAAASALGWEAVRGDEGLHIWAVALRHREHKYFSVRVDWVDSALVFYVVMYPHSWGKPPDDPKNTGSIIYETRSFEEALSTSTLANVTE